MSFRCEECGHVGSARETPRRIVTKVRVKTYYPPGIEPAIGWEVVAEKNLCESCSQTVVDAGAAAHAKATAHVTTEAPPLKVSMGAHAAA